LSSQRPIPHTFPVEFVLPPVGVTVLLPGVEVAVLLPTPVLEVDPDVDVDEGEDEGLVDVVLVVELVFVEDTELLLFELVWDALALLELFDFACSTKK
jgi:hypothetical protein